MRGLFAKRREEGDDVFARIGAFMAEQGLSPDPHHYSFAYHVVTDPGGPVASAVAAITEGGVRLGRMQIEALGGSVTTGPSVSRDAPSAAEDGAVRLVAQTKAQADGLAALMRNMQDETRNFSRDLRESAQAIQQAGVSPGIEGIARITGAMLARVRDTELQLERTTIEADTLRTKLAEANDTARRDALTGLPNRRVFEEAFAARDAAAGPWCVAICDIDRFKRVNDDHGHAVGDRVLSAIGRTLVDECSDHVVVRHGGEEFVILLRGLDLAAAADHLDTVRAVIGAKRLRVRESDQPIGVVTLSFGVTALQPADDSVTALDRADRLLYTAKAQGRDQVCAA